MQSQASQSDHGGIPYETVTLGLGVVAMVTTVFGCVAGASYMALPIGVFGGVMAGLGFERVRQGGPGEVSSLTTGLVLNTIAVALNVLALSAGFTLVVGYILIGIVVGVLT